MTDAERLLLLHIAALVVRIAAAPGTPTDTRRIVELMREVSGGK